MSGPIPNRGFLFSAGKQSGLEFQVNPETIAREETAKYSQSLAPGAVGAHIQYSGGGDRTITFELVLDAIGSSAGDGGVTQQLQALESLTYSASSGVGGRAGSPPRAILGIGNRVWEGVVTQLSVTEEKFNIRLEPVFVRMQVTFLRDLLGSG